MAVQIVCANKPSGNLHDPHEAIEDYGWIEDGTGKRDTTQRQQMVDWVKKGGVAYVRSPLGNQIQCYWRTSARGVEFLQTYSDGTYTDNLVNLPSCPIYR
jgi:hypothetical protein